MKTQLSHADSEALYAMLIGLTSSAAILELSNPLLKEHKDKIVDMMDRAAVLIARILESTECPCVDCQNEADSVSAN